MLNQYRWRYDNTYGVRKYAETFIQKITNGKIAKKNLFLLINNEEIYNLVTCVVEFYRNSISIRIYRQVSLFGQKSENISNSPLLNKPHANL